MNAYLYCDPRSLNDATNFYVDIIKDCLVEEGYQFIQTSSLKKIKNPSLILTITSPYFIKAKIRFPFVKTIHWRQGLGYAEAKMTRPIYKWFPFWFTEFMSVWMSDLIFFVSDCMNEYYRRYFFYRGKNYVIMPCFNLTISKNFSIDRYKNPSFVYAGGISKWQGIDILLDVYALIEQEIPNSSLTLFAKDKEYLESAAKKRGIKNLSIKYVAVDKLQKELENFKYGFILREKNFVNQVATPTKMNSYLAAFLIPIFSDGVDDFNRHINLENFTIMAETPLCAKAIAQKILSFEQSEKDFSLYKNIVERIFDSHYNIQYYKQIIKERLAFIK